MKLEDCKIGGRVRDNIALPVVNQGAGTIIGFCKNVHGQDNITIEWDKARSVISYGHEYLIKVSSVWPGNVDAI